MPVAKFVQFFDEIESALSAITTTKDVKKYKKMILRTRTIIREKKLAAFKNGEINSIEV